MYEKIEQRRYDPIDGRYYNLLKDQVPKEVISRLVQLNEHSHPVVKRKLQDYSNFLATVENEYKKHLIIINTAEDLHTVFLNLCEAVENTV